MTTPPDAGDRHIVVKIGGSTLGGHDTSLLDIAVARREGRKVVVVHGGGAAVSEQLARAGVQARFVHGLRVTDADTLAVVVAVLCGTVNKQLVAELSAIGAPAIGISGADAMILQARRYDDELGYVGKIERVNQYPLVELTGLGYLPVVAPIAIDLEPQDGGRLLNTNADTAAGEIAAALHAAELVFLTDVPAVLDGSRRPVHRLSLDDALRLLSSGAATGGMVPKLEAALRAARAGCATRIIDGTERHALARALAGQAGGTIVEA